MMQTVEIETERLHLRMFSEADVDFFTQMFSDPEVTRYLRALDRDAVLRQLRAFLLHWEERGFGLWVAELKETREVIGRIGLLQHDDWTAGPDNVEVGWALVRRHWGRGLATEGARASIDFGFEHLNLHRIISIARPQNSASLRVMEKCGLKRQGETVWRGHGVVWYAIARAEWGDPGERTVEIAEPSATSPRE